MGNLVWDKLAGIENLTLQECMKQTFHLVNNLKKYPTILRINLEFNKENIDMLLLALRNIDATVFPFGETPHKRLNQRIHKISLETDLSSEQYVKAMHAIVFNFFINIAVYYGSTYSSNASDNKNNYFFFQMEEATIRPILENVIEKMNMKSYVHMHTINDIDLELPYFSEYIANAYDFYWGNLDFFENLYTQLGDDISRQSMKMFLHKNIICQSLSAAMAYTLPPIACTEAWRTMRRTNPPPLPILLGAPQNLINSFYLDTFIFEQYAIAGLVEVKEGDHVIDAGAFIGDTTIYFGQKVGSKGKVYGFEIFEESVLSARENIQKNHCAEQCEILHMGLSNINKTLNFTPHRVASNNSTALDWDAPKNQEILIIQATTIDDFAKNRNIPVNFIKMDVEGAEMEIFEGTKDVIKQYKPTCAISMYHKKDDILNIPRFLKELNPSYTFYIRCEAEAVIFAIDTPV